MTPTKGWGGYLSGNDPAGLARGDRGPAAGAAEERGARVPAGCRDALAEASGGGWGLEGVGGGGLGGVGMKTGLGDIRAALDGHGGRAKCLRPHQGPPCSAAWENQRQRPPRREGVASTLSLLKNRVRKVKSVQKCTLRQPRATTAAVRARALSNVISHAGLSRSHTLGLVLA